MVIKIREFCYLNKLSSSPALDRIQTAIDNIAIGPIF